MEPKTADEFHCEKCHFKCCKLSNWNQHILTIKHNKNGAEKMPVYNCEKCNITCCKLSNWNRHLVSKKHTEGAEKNRTIFACNTCKKEYKSQSSLGYHEGKCNSGMIDRILHDNAELRTLIMEQSKTINKALELCKPVVINNTQNNQNNNKFNIHVYLNETCKDAMNFSDFIDNIDVSREDLENNVQLGFVNGIAKIFMDNLKQLKEHERPIHCTDVKREIMYIKDNNVWTKQVNDDKLNHAVNIISNKGIKQLMIWKRENPDYQDVNSDFSNKCLDIQLSTMAGYNQRIYNPKVIHVIARETAITRANR